VTDLVRPTAEDAATAAKDLATATGADRHDVAVVLGSGWAPAADALGRPAAEVRVGELTGFAAPTAEGHGGTVRSLTIGGNRTLVFLGRTHLYEGRGTAAVAHGVRVAAAAGCRTVVLTNAAGGLRQGMRAGQPVLISDHLNLTGRSPLMPAARLVTSEMPSTSRPASRAAIASSVVDMPTRSPPMARTMVISAGVS